MTEPSVSAASEPLPPHTTEPAALQVTGDIRVTIEAPPELVGSAVIPGGAVFEGTTVGGLSGIAFNPLTGTYLAISDDRGTFGSPRIYELAIHLSDGTLDAADLGIVGVTALTPPPAGRSSRSGPTARVSRWRHPATSSALRRSTKSAPRACCRAACQST